jgi:hypothetical protein
MPRWTPSWAKRVSATCDPDVSGQQKFDAESQAPPLRGGDDRLRPRSSVIAPGIAGVLGPVQRARHEARPHFGEIERGGDVVALRIQHARA